MRSSIDRVSVRTKNIRTRNAGGAKPWQQGAIGLLAVILLSGCESVNEFFPNLPSLYDRMMQRVARSAPNTPVQSSTAAEMEAQVRQQINAIRTQQGLSPLKDNPKLAEVARNYSQRMAEQNFFAHTSPSGDTMVERVGSAGIFYFMLGENLFKGTHLPEPVSAAVQGWMNSPGHRENILRPEYRETGIGVWRQGDTYYFTQLFMRSL